MLEALTTRGRAFVSAGLTLVLSGYLLGFRDLSRIGVLLLALVLLTSLLARQRPRDLVVTRESDPRRVSADDTAVVSVTVTNEGGRGTPLMVAEERLDYQLGERPRVLLGSLGRGETRRLRYAVRPPARGRWLLGPLTVQLRDPFGLTTRFVDVGDPTELVVLPRVWPLGGARPRGTGVGAEGEIPFMVALHGEDDQSIREYRDGDDLRRIHWPATARVGELMVRQEDRPARRRAVVLLDPRVEAHAGSGPASSFEWAVSAVASVVVHVASQGYAVHLLTPETVQDGHADLPVEPDRAVEGLALTETAPALVLRDLIRAGQGLLAGGGLLVAVVAAQDEATLRAMGALRQPGSAAIGLVLDPVSFGRQREEIGVGARAAVDLLRGAGWRATTVGFGEQVGDAWARVGGATARVGEGVLR
ncbi:MAG TPA: DUF58 domain-containing protein [Dermatophilaceae bacterium]|nr:DUF58 domain-containing protein [Dermatophilaceae bacterium]